MKIGWKIVVSAVRYSTPLLGRNSMVERWYDQSDPTDTGVPIDDSYLNTETKDESVTDCYNPEAERITDGGQIVSAKEGDSTGVHWQNESVGDGTWNPDSHTPVDNTPAATIVTGFSPNSRKWRLHEDMKVSVQCDDGSWYTTPHRDSTKRAQSGFLDAKIQRLDISQTVQNAVRKLVSTESKKQWNLRYNGHHGMIIGYAAFYLNPNDMETAKSFAKSVANLYDLTEEEACEAVEYAFQRAEERNLAGSVA
jgi:hypothetical protein